MSRDLAQFDSRPPGAPAAPDGEAAATFFRLAREFEREGGSITVAALALTRSASPESAAESFEEDVVGAFLGAAVAEELSAFRRGVLPTEEATETAGTRELARLGDLHLMLACNRSIQACLWEAWFSSVEAADGAEATRDELLRHGSEFFLRYADALGRRLTEAFRREVERLARSGEQRRIDLARALLSGESLLAAPIELDLEQHHLGVIAWGDGAEAAIRELGSALGRPVLVIGPLAGSWWGWVSGGRALDRFADEELARFRPSNEARMAIGLEAFGEDGFRATNRQALRARRVSRDGDAPVVHYPDVAVAALAGENVEDARAFVAHELRGIEDDSATSRRIRETLIAYFASGHNAASAAAALGIHQQTVANRLRSAEDRLGRPVGERRVELDTALRLRISLGEGD